MDYWNSLEMKPTDTIEVLVQPMDPVVLEEWEQCRLGDLELDEERPGIVLRRRGVCHFNDTFSDKLQYAYDGYGAPLPLSYFSSSSDHY